MRRGIRGGKLERPGGDAYETERSGRPRCWRCDVEGLDFSLVKLEGRNRSRHSVVPTWEAAPGGHMARRACCARGGSSKKTMLHGRRGRKRCGIKMRGADADGSADAVGSASAGADDSPNEGSIFTFDWASLAKLPAAVHRRVLHKALAALGISKTAPHQPSWPRLSPGLPANGARGIPPRTRHSFCSEGSRAKNEYRPRFRTQRQRGMAVPPCIPRARRPCHVTGRRPRSTALCAFNTVSPPSWTQEERSAPPRWR